jgi:Chaperone of endosialidase
VKHFPRNSQPNFAQYISEQPEMSSHGEKSKKAKTTTNKRKSNMKKRNILTTILLVLACFALSPSARAVVPPPDGGYPNENTAEGKDALFRLTTGFGNTALGFNALNANTTGTLNTATGRNALLTNTTGIFNTADGSAALFSNTTGNFNTATGRIALLSNTTGTGNTADGIGALSGNTTGKENIALGAAAGDNLTTGDNNIDIGNEGIADEANTIRIGDPEVQTATFIAGIRGTTTGNGDAITVVIDSAGQLGTMSSSRRFKKEIKPMDQTSEAILGLKPVTFHYKNDSKGKPQFGLIAEEVAKVNPDLVVRDAQGEIYTVRYDAVNAMLLNEFLKEHKRVEQQEATIAQLESTVAQQQKGMAALAASLKEQAAQIQKVSAQLRLNKPAPRLLVNNQ